MKTLYKLIFTVFALVIVGGGGLGTGNSSKEATDTRWWLSFELPDGWVMYGNYTKNNADPSTRTIDRQNTDVVIQSSTLPIILPGKSAGEGVTSFVDADYTYIRVFRYDVALTKVPDDAEDLGDGFYKATKEDITTYYLKGQYGIYRFITTQVGRDLSEAEKVILTAIEVTDVADQTATE